MTDYIQKKCPNCDQQLRFPCNLGGMLMACPSCGARFHSDFKMSCANRGGSSLRLTLIHSIWDKVRDFLR